MVVHFWLRAETKPAEKRTHLTPDKCRELVNAGCIVTVETSDQRIFKDDEYRSVPGIEMVPLGSWIYAPKDAIILGLKDLPSSDEPIRQRHVYLAHAYKNQLGCEQLLQRFNKGGGSILDIEYLIDDNGKVPANAVFSFSAGSVGMALGVCAWCHQKLGRQMPSVIPYESELHLVNEVKGLLKQVAYKKGLYEVYPTLLVVGARGQAGSGSLNMAEKLGIPDYNKVKWNRENTKEGGPFQEILGFDIFVNCINLSKKIPPLLTPELLNTNDRKLTIIVDVSCDFLKRDNPLPIYEAPTTPKHPARSIAASKTSKPLELVAIDHFPSLLPREVSERFANTITPYLKTLATANPDSVWKRAKDMFDVKVQEVCQKSPSAKL